MNAHQSRRGASHHLERGTANVPGSWTTWHVQYAPFHDHFAPIYSVHRLGHVYLYDSGIVSYGERLSPDRTLHTALAERGFASLEHDDCCRSTDDPPPPAPLILSRASFRRMGTE